ncbi:MAG: RIP metalloprotease RseP [Chitinophagales bacterium]|nr:RIP metalloprotease RseP [Chitinophagales bacterium]
MDGLIMAAQLLLALGLLVFIHELGHFLAARAFGIKVEKFYIFFDFNNIKLYSKKIGDTEYGIGWFPLGGYVKIAGMVDESLDTEQLKQPPQPWEFRSKPAWQRFIVMIGGITMNIILGIIIFTFYLSYYSKAYVDPTTVTDGIYAYKTGQEVGFKTGDKILAIDGKKPERAIDLVSAKVFSGAVVTIQREGKEMKLDLPDTLFKKMKDAKDDFIALHNYRFYVDSVYPYLNENPKIASTAFKAGLKKGDEIVAIQGEPVKVFGDVRALLTKYDSAKVELQVKRDGQLVTLNTDTIRNAALGFKPGPEEPYTTTPYSFGKALKYGTKDGFSAIYYNALGIGKIFQGQVSARDSIQSPIGIAQIFGGKWIWAKFWYLTGLISFILAFMNILPIPALDGGHVMFIIVELIQGKPVSEKFLEAAQKVGIVILLALMVFAFGNDLIKIFT